MYSLSNTDGSEIVEWTFELKLEDAQLPYWALKIINQNKSLFRIKM